ncbi:hypothetical protein PsorP6_017216 [Peronosclerospora sorghi]|uniref:Uncharacterized protein n=1 Tax=Peronosclerospora sorghi TaxID=230839 RepID=A0ACC0WFQ5_9STRA|nr:hypothetical protein PsorP6_017216 [Peronosclerospora sorghi]
MGGGGLRILPHKKWHVWRRENIERVYRDEQKQRDVDAKRRKVEQERRAEQLLSTKGHHRQEHINFFATEAALASPGTNGYRRKNHVGGSDETLRKHGKLPWYAQAKDAKNEMSAKQEKKSKRCVI